MNNKTLLLAWLPYDFWFALEVVYSWLNGIWTERQWISYVFCIWSKGHRWNPILFRQTSIVMRQWNTKYCVIKHQMPSKETQQSPKSEIIKREKGLDVFFSRFFLSAFSVQLSCAVLWALLWLSQRETIRPEHRALIFMYSFVLSR